MGDQLDEKFGDLSVFIQLTSHPKSLLFDPFDTLPTRQGEEVVTAMNHCKYSVPVQFTVSDPC